MRRNAFIIVVCIVTVVIVLGLPDRLTYTGMQEALAMLDPSVDELVNDFQIIGIANEITEYYLPYHGQYFYTVKFDVPPVNIGTKKAVQVWVLDTDGDVVQFWPHPPNVGFLKSYTYQDRYLLDTLILDEKSAMKLDALLAARSHRPADGVIAGVIETVGNISYYITYAGMIFTDTVSVTYNFGRAVLYLLGF